MNCRNRFCDGGRWGRRAAPTVGVKGGSGYDRDRCRQAGLIVPHPFPRSHQISTSGNYLISYFVCLLQRTSNKGALREQQQPRPNRATAPRPRRPFTVKVNGRFLRVSASRAPHAHVSGIALGNKWSLTGMSACVAMLAPVSLSLTGAISRAPRKASPRGPLGAGVRQASGRPCGSPRSVRPA